MTAGKLSAADAILCNLADVCVPVESLPEIAKALADCQDASSVHKLLQARAHELAPGALQTARDWIDWVYANTTVETILAALEAREEPATKSARQEIAGKSPSSLKVTVRLLREARKSLDLKSCLQREYIAALACIRKHDFVEGVRAAVVDKDRAPRWSPSNLTEVTEAMVDLYFKASPQTVLF